MRTYTTKAGETWDVVAKEVYGSELYTSYLMENNQQAIHLFKFPAGVVLNIKNLPEEESNLPDWRS